MTQHIGGDCLKKGSIPFSVPYLHQTGIYVVDSFVCMDMELGNMIFGNSRGEYEVDRKYQDEFYYLLQEITGKDSWAHDSYFDDDTWTIRPYCWNDECECEGDEHDPGCELVLPNFVCKPLGFELKWYKYPLRDSYSNMPLTDELMMHMVAYSANSQQPYSRL